MGSFFREPDGRVRLWFRLLGYIALMFVFLMLSAALTVGLFRAGVPGWAVQPLNAAISIGLILWLTLFYRRRIDRRAWAGMALPPPHKQLHALLAGLALGSAMIALVFTLQWLSGGIRVTVAGGSTVLALLAPSLLSYAGVGFTEELAMRGYVFQNLGERYPLWLAALWNGVIFGALHFARVTGLLQWVLLIASAAVISVLLMASRLATGSLWLAIGWHTAWDWVQDPILGLAGGPALLHVERTASVALVGTPQMSELGLFTILVEALGALLLLFWAWRRGDLNWGAVLTPDGEPAKRPSATPEAVTSPPAG